MQFINEQIFFSISNLGIFPEKKDEKEEQLINKILIDGNRIGLPGTSNPVMATEKQIVLEGTEEQEH